MWMRSATFVFFAIALGMLAATHILALEFFLYWTYLWFDIPMHALGGAVAALGFLTLQERFRLYDGFSLRSKPSTTSCESAPHFLTFFRACTGEEFQKGLLVTLGAVLVVGILWEVFELSIGMPSSETNYVGDTVLDLVTDLVGASIGYVCARAAARFNRALL